MKKLQFSVFTMVMMALVCVGFASCGSDDDDDAPSGSQLIGTWYESDSYYTDAFCFKSDGTGWNAEWENGNEREHSHHRDFTWKAEGNQLFTYNIDDGELRKVYTFEISNGGKTLTLRKSSGEIKGVYTKQ